MCLRFVAFYRRYDPETGALKDLEALTTMLDKTILELNKESIGELCTLAETFGYSMERCYALLGDAAFSKQGMNHIINKPLFVSWSVVLAHSETERWSLEEMRNMEFNRLTILTGANAAGKSSVIQALLLLSHTSEFMVNRGEAWSEESIDVNQVLGIQVGAPNALICQNPTEDEAFDFAFDLRADGKQHIFQYAVDKTSPLDLKIKKGQPFPDTEIQYLNAECIGPRMVNQAGKKNGIALNGENATYLMDIADKSRRGGAGAGKPADDRKSGGTSAPLFTEQHGEIPGSSGVLRSAGGCGNPQRTCDRRGQDPDGKVACGRLDAGEFHASVRDRYRDSGD